MSEYQFINFRALDRPLTDKQLKFMDRQSTRAEFTKWEFSVEYHYSSFRGDINGMLRNGYDLFLSYSNYGGREIRMRLPNGLPFPKGVWSKYTSSEGLTWTADKSGKAGILELAPYLEELDDQVGDFDDYLDAMSKLRAMLVAGDLRVLYVLWLCCATSFSEEEEEVVMEPPVPHGLSGFPSEAAELLDFFDVDPLLVRAAATGIPSFDSQGSHGDSVNSWLQSTKDSQRTEIIQRLLSEDPLLLKAELLSEIQDRQQAIAWPVAPPSRSVTQLLEMCEILRQKENKKQQQQAAAKAKRKAADAEKLRQARMTKMKTAPEDWIKQASKLVEGRGHENYREAANILADLREAVGGAKGDKITREHAAHLIIKYPTLSVLKSALRKKQLLD